MIAVVTLLIAMMAPQMTMTSEPMYLDDVWTGEATCEVKTAECVSEVVQYAGIHLGPNSYRFSISKAAPSGEWEEQEYQDGYFEPDTRTWKADRLIDATPAGQGFPDWQSIGNITLIESEDGKMLFGVETDVKGTILRKIQLARLKK